MNEGPWIKDVMMTVTEVAAAPAQPSTGTCLSRGAGPRRPPGRGPRPRLCRALRPGGRATRRMDDGMLDAAMVGAGVEAACGGRC